VELTTHFHRVPKLEYTKLYLNPPPPQTSSWHGDQLTTRTPSPYFICGVGLRIQLLTNFQPLSKPILLTLFFFYNLLATAESTIESTMIVGIIFGRLLPNLTYIVWPRV
jgi:hypothetical protein